LLLIASVQVAAAAAGTAAPGATDTAPAALGATATAATTPATNPDATATAPPAGGAAAVDPAAAVPNVRAMDAGLQSHWKAMSLQAVEADATVVRPNWEPLSAMARSALELSEGSDLHSRYLRELERARVEMTDGQRSRFGTRWQALAQACLRQALAYVTGRAVAHVSEQLSCLRAIPSPPVMVLARIASLVERQSCMALEADRLLELQSHPSLTAAYLEASLADLPLAAAATAAPAAPAAAADDTAAADDAAVADAASAHAFPDVGRLHGGPGLLHLLKFGLLGVVYKIYFTPLLSFVGHAVLRRKYVTATVSHFFACDSLYYRTNEILLSLMFESHQKHKHYLTHKESLTTNALYTTNFLEWYEMGLESRDVPFIFYSNFVFGVGMLYRMGKQAISMRDPIGCHAILLPAMGLFKMCLKHNLSLQCFLSLVKLLTSSEEVAKALLANIMQCFGDRPFHAIGTDELLEMLQGFVKKMTGKKWDVANAQIHTSLNFVFNGIRDELASIAKGDEEVERATKGVRVKDGKADTLRGHEKMRGFGLFNFDLKRDSLSSLPAGLVPKDYELPTAYLQREAGGLLNFARPMTPEFQPALERASALVQELLERSGAVDGSAGAPEELVHAAAAAAATDADATEAAAAEAAHDGRCQVCTTRAAFKACKACDACGALCCPACATPTIGGDGSVCWVCASRGGDDDEYEVEARAAAGARGEVVEVDGA